MLRLGLKRLEHNSYDILILHDGFSKRDSLKLTAMAYAMTRPSLIVCDSWFAYIKYIIWRKFTKFFKKFKISKRLIKLSLNNEEVIGKIVYLANNHIQYFDKINEEISEVTKQ